MTLMRNIGGYWIVRPSGMYPIYSGTRDVRQAIFIGVSAQLYGLPLEVGPLIGGGFHSVGDAPDPFWVGAVPPVADVPNGGGGDGSVSFITPEEFDAHDCKAGPESGCNVCNLYALQEAAGRHEVRKSMGKLFGKKN